MTMFILPGLLCNLSMFAATMEAFPGASGVDDFYGQETTLPGMAAHALARAPDRFVLLGHSMGARIALEIMRVAPERVSALILADTGIHPAREGERDKRYELRDIGREQGFGALIDTWLPPMLAPDRQGDAALVDGLRAMCLSAGQERFEGQIEALLARPVVEDLLPLVTVPTLSIVGELDAWSPPKQHRQIADLIPGARLEIVTGAGHMLPAEDAASFNAALADFLAPLPPTC
jgi:pimeloyl-ACP methyl ester carboxylesterase